MPEQGNTARDEGAQAAYNPPGYWPLDERLLALLQAEGSALDETDAANALAAIWPAIERIEREHDRALDAITEGVDLIRRFDPTCGTGRTRTFLADLERVLRGRSDG